MTDLMEFSEEVCECGVSLDVHPPLVKPSPMKSWMATRNSDERLSANAKLGREASGWSMTISKNGTPKTK